MKSCGSRKGKGREMGNIYMNLIGVALLLLLYVNIFMLEHNAVLV